MSEERIPLAKAQREIMQEFYNIKPTKVIFDKKKRKQLWDDATKHKDMDFSYLKKVCPALEHRIKMSYEPSEYDEEKNIQSAVFSECVYAQTYANMLNLNIFVNCYEDRNFIPNEVLRLINSYNLFPRYAYSTSDKKRMLIQAGSCNGIDSALITVIDLTIYTIEFKEPYAKTSEPDLPKYGEDGVLIVDSIFLGKYPQFETMLDEQEGLNFFEKMGNNIHDFSEESIKLAVSNNYKDSKKYADVICTEDINGYFVMMPSNQVSLWCKMEGEIRPSGRNHYNVWTPNSLKKFLKTYNAEILGTKVSIEKTKLELRKERGGNGKVSGYKITPLFFVYAKDCNDNGTTLTFDISKVQQLNPTIAAKMDFRKTLKYAEVKSYYEKLF